MSSFTTLSKKANDNRFIEKILYRIAHERQTSKREEVNLWKNTNIESRNLRTLIVLVNNGVFMASRFPKFDIPAFCPPLSVA